MEDLSRELNAYVDTFSGSSHAPAGAPAHNHNLRRQASELSAATTTTHKATTPRRTAGRRGEGAMSPHARHRLWGEDQPLAGAGVVHVAKTPTRSTVVRLGFDTDQRAGFSTPLNMNEERQRSRLLSNPCTKHVPSYPVTPGQNPVHPAGKVPMHLAISPPTERTPSWVNKRQPHLLPSSPTLAHPVDAPFGQVRPTPTSPRRDLRPQPRAGWRI